MAEPSMIDGYLQRLRDRLGRSAETDADVTEVADHLRESTASELAGGHSEHDAETIAISRFGTVEEVARRLRASRNALPARLRLHAGVLGALSAATLFVAGAAIAYVFGRTALPRPNAERLLIVSLGVGTFLLVAFLAVQTMRLRRGRFVTGLLLTLPVPGSLLLFTTIYAAFGSLVVFRPWVGVLVPMVAGLLLAIGLWITLQPLASDADGPRWARLLLATAAPLYVAAPALWNAMFAGTNSTAINGTHYILSLNGLMTAIALIDAGLLLLTVVALLGISRPLLVSHRHSMLRSTTAA
ncbi:MAG: permease prefix domain 1-containing protein [Nakamurella sp.]